MKLNNKGYSLLELIIAFAILSIVSLMVVGFMSASSSAFRSVNAEVSLQVESQLAMGQLQEYLIDCSGGVSYDAASKTLYVLNKAEDGAGTMTYTLHTFKLDGDALYYDTQNPILEGSAGAWSLSYYDVNSASYHPDLMASNVTAFNLVVNYAVGTVENIATGATVTLTFVKSGKSYTATQEVAFRNTVLYGSSIVTLANAVVN